MKEIRLSDFILENRKLINKEWQKFAQQLFGNHDEHPSVIIDHIDEILTAIAADM